MTIDPSISSTPFANTSDVGYHQKEEETLFSMHTVFRVGQIKQIDGNNRLWQVDLTLTSDNDVELNTLTECIREETSSNENGWYRMGQLLIRMAQYNEAQKIYKVLLHQTTVDGEKAKIYQQLAVVNSSQGEYNEAITFSEKSLEINSKILPPNHPDLGISYNNMGSLYQKMEEYMKALSFQGKALDIFQKSLPPNHPSLASSYEVLGKILNVMGEYPKALAAHEKALQIQQHILPSNHPDLAMLYHNLGEIYDNMGNYSKALPFYERALDIGQRSLPSDHPDLQIYKQSIESLKKKM